MAPTLRRRGASTTFLLSFVTGAPLLNVTTIALALALLPWPFAVTRIVAGIVVTMLVTYLVVRVADRWQAPGTAAEAAIRPDTRWAHRLGDAYLKLLAPAAIFDASAADRPSELVRGWLRASGRIALVLVPTLWVWSVIASWMFQAFPSTLDNDLASVALSSMGGTLFMISTWSEIPIALQLIQAGAPGPAAALLVVLPAISLPCMMLLAGSLQRYGLVALLSLSVTLVGIAAGAMFP